eukprot:TRINITY_DN9783_c0_g1_i1.p1 TRINITY_DN9783_c0_g1~~TRINITY_DN9783_c0_g1_i1.p1  ORF type:complete len:386 (+),score=39.77 TRINITY_DN9783_c0_g1_i1:37-1158(+)
MAWRVHFGSADSQPGGSLLGMLGAGRDLVADVSALARRYSIDDTLEKRTVAVLRQRGDAWAQDVRDLDHALSKAQSPAGLLPHRLAEIEQLISLQNRGKNGHLPGCICRACKATAFQRAVGVGQGNAATTSLNASSLLAYQELMQMQNGGGSSDEPPGPAEQDDTYLAPPPKSYKPKEEMIPEIRNLGARYKIQDALVSRLMQFLKGRGEDWYQDLCDLTINIQRSRNPNSMLGGKLALAEKSGVIPKPACVHFRQGKCKYGLRCQKSHDPEAQAELPALSEVSTTPCYDFLNGRCKHGGKCIYLHDISQMPAKAIADARGGVGPGGLPGSSSSLPFQTVHRTPNVMDRVTQKHSRTVIVNRRSRSRSPIRQL